MKTIPQRKNQRLTLETNKMNNSTTLKWLSGASVFAGILIIILAPKYSHSVGLACILVGAVFYLFSTECKPKKEHPESIDPVEAQQERNRIRHNRKTESGAWLKHHGSMVSDEEHQEIINDALDEAIELVREEPLGVTAPTVRDFEVSPIATLDHENVVDVLTSFEPSPSSTVTDCPSSSDCSAD